MKPLETTIAAMIAAHEANLAEAKAKARTKEDEQIIAAQNAFFQLQIDVVRGMHHAEANGIRGTVAARALGIILGQIAGNIGKHSATNLGALMSAFIYATEVTMGIKKPSPGTTTAARTVNIRDEEQG
jgi:hypothetical protein